jgi:hypothetical protein
MFGIIDLTTVAEASMLDPTSSVSQPVRLERPPPFERIALLLQGGGALGAYQAGVYQALAHVSLLRV